MALELDHHDKLLAENARAAIRDAVSKARAPGVESEVAAPANCRTKGLETDAVDGGPLSRNSVGWPNSHS